MYQVATDYDFLGTCRALTTVSASIKKIANDIRLLGSCIMLRKVNISQCEAISNICAQIMESHVDDSCTSDAKNFGLLQSLKLLGDACSSLEMKCLTVVEANHEEISKFLHEELLGQIVGSKLVECDRHGLYLLMLAKLQPEAEALIKHIEGEIRKWWDAGDLDSLERYFDKIGQFFQVVVQTDASLREKAVTHNFASHFFLREGTDIGIMMCPSTYEDSNEVELDGSIHTIVLMDIISKRVASAFVVDLLTDNHNNVLVLKKEVELKESRSRQYKVLAVVGLMLVSKKWLREFSYIPKRHNWVPHVAAKCGNFSPTLHIKFITKDVYTSGLRKSVDFALKDEGWLEKHSPGKK